MADSPKETSGTVRFVALRLIIACIGAIAFGLLGYNVAVGADWLLPFDRSIQAVIFPLRDPSLTPVIETITHLSGTKITLAIAVVFAVILFIRSRGKGIAFILIVGVGEALAFGAKFFVDRGRPYGLNLIEFPGDPSFPSGHTFAAIAIIAFIIFVLLREFKHSLPMVVKVLLVIIAVLWPLIIGFTRLYLGVHWPTDVFGSLILGALVYFPLATLVWDSLFRPVEKRGKHAR